MGDSDARHAGCVLFAGAGPGQCCGSNQSSSHDGSQTRAEKGSGAKSASRPRVQTAPTRERIVEIQEALAREGFYSGKPSGKWDPATSEAMRNSKPRMD